MQGWALESQCPPGAEPGEGHEGHEGLPEVYQQQKADKGKRWLTVKWGEGPGDKGH